MIRLDIGIFARYGDIRMCDHTNFETEYLKGFCKFHNRKTLRKMTSDIDEEIFEKIRAAQSIETDEMELLLLGSERNHEIQSALAYNPKTPLEILEKLTESENAWTLICLAQNCSTPPELLTSLGRHEYSWVRETVALNPTVPLSAMLMLSSDKIWFIKKALIRNPKYIELGESNSTLAELASRLEINSEEQFEQGEQDDRTPEELLSSIEDNIAALEVGEYSHIEREDALNNA